MQSATFLKRRASMMNCRGQQSYDSYICDDDWWATNSFPYLPRRQTPQRERLADSRRLYCKLSSLFHSVCISAALVEGGREGERQKRKLAGEHNNIKARHWDWQDGDVSSLLLDEREMTQAYTTPMVARGKYGFLPERTSHPPTPLHRMKWNCCVIMWMW